MGPKGAWHKKWHKKSEYFDRLVVYIHLNPVVAGLVGDPADHVFSGHRELLGARSDEMTKIVTTLGLAPKTKTTDNGAMVSVAPI